MSLTASACARLEQFAPIILAASEGEIDTGVAHIGPSKLRDVALSLGRHGDYSAFYAPFDWVNASADIVIVGVTPGVQQATEALKTLRRMLLSGGSSEEAARLTKESASFKGGMRSLGARLMDHFALNELFGLDSTADLFGAARERAHYTSALRYPVLKGFKNYAGDSRLMQRPFLRQMVDEYLAEELAGFPDAWIVPFGPTALLAVDALAHRGVVNQARVLGGILHPGGQQWNRYNVQLGLVDEKAAALVPGGPEVLRRSALLRAKVRDALAARRSAASTPLNAKDGALSCDR